MPELPLEPPATRPPAPPDAPRETGRAAFFVRLVQGTMALEGQAVDAAGRRRLLEQAERLLADPRQVWGEP